MPVPVSFKTIALKATAESYLMPVTRLLNGLVIGDREFYVEAVGEEVALAAVKAAEDGINKANEIIEYITNESERSQLKEFSEKAGGALNAFKLSAWPIKLIIKPPTKR